MASSVVLLFCACFVACNSPSTSAKTPLHVGVFFPMSGGGWTGGNGLLPAIQIALEDVNHVGILRDYELKVMWNDTMGLPGRAIDILYQYLHDPLRKVFLLGAGYSSCSTAIASLAGLDSWRIPQISFASTSPELSNKKHYPYFYRTIPADSSFNRPRIALLRTFNWSHVATIHQEEDIHRAAISDLQLLFHAYGIDEIASEGFREDATTQMASIKKKDARIIIGNFFGKGARKVFCQAYKLKMYGPRYVWILIGYMEEEWWNYADPSVDCTPSQMLEAANGYLATNNLWHASLNHTMVAGKKIAEFYKEYNRRVPKAARDTHSGYTYDAVWTMAIALNKTIAELPAHVQLDKVPYGDKITMDLILKALNETRFFGITGPVSFTENGDRIGDTEFLQLLDGKKHMVGLYESHKDAINWTGYRHKIVWAGGAPPADRVRRVYQLMSISLGLFIFMSVLSVIGIACSVFFLWFNTTYRKFRFIKMSSPKLNNVIILGCILNYTSVLLFGMDGNIVSKGFEIVCVSRAWFLTIGFSLACGAMFSKTWRVHVIFTNRKLRRKVVKDHHLFGVVLVLLAVDLVCLVAWQLIDPLQRVVKDSTSLSFSLDATLVNQLEQCESMYTYRWVGILFGYKGLLLLLGAFLAWETRNVTISALNDSKYIGMSVYNVFILCVIGAPISFAMKDQPDASFSIVAISIIFCTSITLSLVFIPKVLEMKKSSAAVNDREQMGRTFTSYGLGVAAQNMTIDTSQEVIEYKKQLEEKDKEIKRLRSQLEGALRKQDDNAKQEEDDQHRILPAQTQPPD